MLRSTKHTMLLIPCHAAAKTVVAAVTYVLLLLLLYAVLKLKCAELNWTKMRCCYACVVSIIGNLKTEYNSLFCMLLLTPHCFFILVQCICFCQLLIIVFEVIKHLSSLPKCLPFKNDASLWFIIIFFLCSFFFAVLLLLTTIM